ncbi:MAG: hypothetical protein ACYSUP_16960, partial [Planctomycetota bacterium]
AFLFSFWFSTASMVLFVLTGTEIMDQMHETGRTIAEIVIPSAFIAGLLAASLAGVLNNLRVTRPKLDHYKNKNNPSYIYNKKKTNNNN